MCVHVIWIKLYLDTIYMDNKLSQILILDYLAEEKKNVLKISFIETSTTQ